MQNVKTAISIQKSLFEQAEKVARKMKVSRSRLFALALEDYIHREQNRELLTQINAAYADEPDSTEQTLRRKARRTHRRIVRGEW
jgi:metal-responsive CopG/Arc/MetJ family transcriptional regulator